MTVQEFYDWALENDKWSDDLYEVLDQMEQSPFIVILDKIRAEIEEMPTYYREIIRNSATSRKMVILDEVIQILDTYKAESEVEDGNDD